ncbi:MAG: hypothetical protein E7405_02980 [Ruminococcaceae bacterium]|nr:hypothetical protein [Oscillospiraceae bacterium]
MDTYLEYLVKQKYTASKILIIVGLYLLATILSFLSFLVALRSPFIFHFYVLVLFIFFYGARFFSKKLCVEYEYIVTNDELDVDRIIARKTRKRFLTVSVKAFEEFGKVEDDTVKRIKPAVKIVFDASMGKDSDNRYYAVFNNKNGDKMLLIFNPTNKMLDLFKIYNPRVINI